MKNLLLIFVLAFSFSTTAFSSNIGDDKLSVIKNELVELSLENAGQKSFILSSAINLDKETLQLIFENSVSLIQVYDMEGTLEMVLPIGSDEVDLGLSLFDNGMYKLGFMVDGIDEMQFTNLKVK